MFAICHLQNTPAARSMFKSRSRRKCQEIHVGDILIFSVCGATDPFSRCTVHWVLDSIVCTSKTEMFHS